MYSSELFPNDINVHIYVYAVYVHGTNGSYQSLFILQIIISSITDTELECSLPPDMEYSLVLYHNKSIPYKRDGYAVFAVSLCHPLYIEVRY